MLHVKHGWREWATNESHTLAAQAIFELKLANVRSTQVRRDLGFGDLAAILASIKGECRLSTW